MRDGKARPGLRPGGWSRHLAAIVLALAALALGAVAVPAQQPIRVTDIAGREIVLAQPAKRIVLGAFVSLDVLSLIHPDPVGLLVGWAEGGANGIQPAVLRGKSRRSTRCR